jgi:hypothetical protein
LIAGSICSLKPKRNAYKLKRIGPEERNSRVCAYP